MEPEDNENEETAEVAQQETAQENHDSRDNEGYRAIIEQQNKAIAERDARIDKLIEQVQGLVNSHGNYKEPGAGHGMQNPNPVQEKEPYQPLSELDFSI